jgi:hypothetical protein
MAFLRSKLALILFAAIVVAGICGFLAARSAMPQAAVSASSGGSGSGGTATVGGSVSTTATTGSSSSPTAGGTGGGGGSTKGGGVPPTATATRVPPTPTPIPQAGQPLTVRGDVTSVTTSSNSFVVHVFGGGGTYTCTVSQSTTWSGVASSISTLRVGMQVDASGVYQGGGAVTVSHVDADQ